MPSPEHRNYPDLDKRNGNSSETHKTKTYEAEEETPVQRQVKKLRSQVPDYAAQSMNDSCSMNTSDLGRKIQASIMQGMYVSDKVAAFRQKRQQDK